MTAFIKLSTLEYPRHEGDIRLEHPEIGNTFECPNTYALVTLSDKPPYSFKTQVLYEGQPQQINGDWFSTWVLRDKTAQEIEEENKLRDSIPNVGLDGSGSAPNVIN
jgi:hypothetical protein